MLTIILSVANRLPTPGHFLAIALTLGLSVFSWIPQSHAQSHDLTASVDRKQISIEETLTLSVRYSGQVQGDQPDFSLLRENFDIISQGRSNQIRAFNGNMTAFTEWTLMLAPKKVGQLLIPSFKYNGSFSEAIQITVTEASAPPGQLKDIFIETTIDHSQVYVQEQLLLTYRLYTTRSIDSMDAQELHIDGVRVEQLPEARFQRNIDGINYGVLEVRYALFPQTSESFTIPPLRWTLRVVTGQNQRPFGFGSRYELKRLMTEEKAVEVNSNPDTYPADEVWLPAANLELTQKWSSPPSDFRVGEPVTRTITIRAQGLTAAQLPPLEMAEPEGVRLYPDQPVQDNAKSPQGITGTRVESMAVVPDKAGEITLPAVEVTWWDTGADELRRAQLPAQTIYVAPGEAAEQDAVDKLPARIGRADEAASDEPAKAEDRTAAGATGSERLWQATTLLFALLWIIFTLLWWRARRSVSAASAGGREPPDAAASSEKLAFREVTKAARRQDLANLRLALLRWGVTRWPEHPPRSLRDLAAQLDDPALTKQLADLDAALYGQASVTPETIDQVKPLNLAKQVEDWRKRRHASRQVRAERLKPLY